MSRLWKMHHLLAIIWLGMTVTAEAGTIAINPLPASSQDVVLIRFDEDDWYDSCPPELEEVNVDGREISIRLGVTGGCILAYFHNPYTVSVAVGPLLAGYYNVTVEAPDYSSREPEWTTATLKVREAVRCGLVNRPAATLLLPYFEVDFEDPGGRNTLFSVGNVASAPVLAHAVMWTNRGRPALSFDFFIPAEGLLPFNVRDLLRGRLPETSPPAPLPAGSFASCTDPVTAPRIDGEVLRALFTGRPHPAYGLCYSDPVEDGRLATGSITIDVVRDCSGDALRTPFDAGYFEDGGQGLATNDNVLWGDFFLVDADNDATQGEELVTIIADVGLFGGLVDPPYARTTFYGGRDDRMPLAQTYRARFLNGGTFAGESELVVWFEGDSGVTPCDAPPGSFNQVTAEFRHQSGEPIATHSFSSSEHTFRVRVGGDRLPVGESFGSVDISAMYFNGIIGVPIEYDLQIWVMPLLSAKGRFSVGTSAVPIKDFCR